jgi:hypothetical protein
LKTNLHVKYFNLLLVRKLRDIFTNINEMKYDLVNVIVKILSTELLITKGNANLSLIKILAGDDTGMINVILKNDFMKYTKINKELIIRNAKIEEINGHIYIVCDELCSVFDSSNMINFTSDSYKINFSDIKIEMLIYELF